MPTTKHPHPKRRQAWATQPALLLMALLLTGVLGCMAPMPDDGSAAQDEGVPLTAAPAEPDTGVAAPAVRDSRPPPRQAPPMSDPLPPLRAPERDAQRTQRTVPAGQPVKVDTSCTRDADCTVKNVGNCCGYYPACVNVGSPTDPAAVQAKCASEGMMSVCGFPSITACQCVAGQCQADTAAVEQ